MISSSVIWCHTVSYDIKWCHMVSYPPHSALSPMWKALHTMCNDLVAAHTQFVQLLMDLSREVSEYNIVQREKMKGNVSEFD